jgi:hypothetical protein
MIATMPVQALMARGTDAQPASTVASEAYVLVGASVQGTTLAGWHSDGSAPSQLVVVGYSGSSGAVWEFSPGAGSSGSAIACGIQGVSAVGIVSNYALIL